MSRIHRIRSILVAVGILVAGSACAQQALPTLAYVGSNPVYNRSLGLTEPSGLSLNSFLGYFWTVSDDTGRIFALDRDGRIIGVTPPNVALQDLEGIVEDRANLRLLAIAERRSEIIEIPLGNPGQAIRHPLRSLPGYDRVAEAFRNSRSNDGPEGIALNSDTGVVELLKERNPRLLIGIDRGLNRILNVTRLGPDMGMTSPETDDSALDISGLTFDARRNARWILSANDEAVFYQDIRTGRFARYPLILSAQESGRRIKSPEGIALSPDGSSLFVISDRGWRSRLYEYRIE